MPAREPNDCAYLLKRDVLLCSRNRRPGFSSYLLSKAYPSYDSHLTIHILV